MKHTARCLLLGAALLASLPVFAQYSWIDNSGRKVFSDQPPPSSIPEKNILSAHPMPSAAPVPAALASAAGGEDKALEAKKQAADAATATKDKAEEQKLAAQRADNCQRARRVLAGLDSGARIVQFDAQGQRSYMTEDQRLTEIERTQGIIDSDCKGVPNSY